MKDVLAAFVDSNPPLCCDDASEVRSSCVAFTQANNYLKKLFADSRFTDWFADLAAQSDRPDALRKIIRHLQANVLDKAANVDVFYTASIAHAIIYQ
eukprot:5558236-Pyramimonas_sp.AAC.1